MYAGIEYEDNIERGNMSDRIAVVVPEYNSKIITTPKRLSYINTVRMGSGDNKDHSNVLSEKQNTTR